MPVIVNDLHSGKGYTWIGGAYVLANAVCAPIWGKLSDIWGRKTILLAAITVFFTASIVCAAANSMSMLIVGRAIQGVAGVGLILMVHVVMSDVFSARSARPTFSLTFISIDLVVGREVYFWV